MEAFAFQSPTCRGCTEAAKRITQQESQIGRLQARIQELSQLVEQLRRGGKRQAAPFSKGPPKSAPKKPGRKPGAAYGTKARRAVPPVIDEELEAPLPICCPDCHGIVIPQGVDAQFQTEIPVKPIYRKFNIHFGRCRGCGRRVQGRHPLQTSDALGACASQLGPNAQAAIVQLNKQSGLSHGKIAAIFSSIFGIKVSRSAVCQSMMRTAGKCLPHYHDILRTLPLAPWAVMDETGWRCGGLSAWLHVAVTEQATAFLVDRHRGFEGSSRLMPPDYAGTLIHDGYAPYRRFTLADHQSCIGHLQRRGTELLETARGGAARFPHQVKGILQDALETRDRRDAGQIAPATAARKAGQLQSQIARLCEPVRTHTDNDRFARHLYREQEHLFTFLRRPGLDATNYRAEQALRGPIANRKIWGGNRTEIGTASQGILSTIWATACKQAIEPFQWFSQLLRSPSTVAELVPKPRPKIVPDTG